MAKIERELRGNFYEILARIESVVLQSASATLEEKSNFVGDKCKCAVMIFERYSMIGGNRVSLSVTLFQSETKIHISATASGGSQALLIKLNTFGEEAFLDCIRDAIGYYS